MSNQEKDFLVRWNAEKQSYRNWGDFVVDRVKKLISAEIAPRDVDYFVRVPPIPRLKDDESLLQKAFHRGKPYKSPYDEIEDKVGVRFVLLLDTDIRRVAKAIENETEVWTAVKARDHEEEIENKPYEFDYQSIHYVVRSVPETFWKGEKFPENLPCEIQVRTLLQHAYSEVVHDTLYKPSIKTTPQMKRSAAKSMALLEATSDYFERLNDLIAKEVQPLLELSAVLSREYTELVGKSPTGESSPLNDLVLDRYGHSTNADDIIGMLKTVQFIGPRIAERAEQIASFRIPSILLIYYSVATARHSTPCDCPISETDLELIYSDLGLSLHG
ncbi:MAG: RelA/SpoT domain-containing protein [Cohaesibacter sp.]|jgi:ppGpp synthetase/RelA/SpoT-type nucleotidyltranferase|nr:RelA/SpoT domain-containing protein [Cohaesibacter sp.]